jgi:hypothetical protein
MAGVKNRLTGAAQFLNAANGDGQWQTSDIDVGEILISERAPGTDFKQLELSISEGSTVGSISLSNIQLKQADSGAPIVLIFALKIPSGGTVTTTLIDESSTSSNIVTTEVNAQQSAAAVNAPGILSPQWFIFRSDSITINEPTGTPTVSINIDFEPTNPLEKFYFTMPAMYQKYEFFTNNPAVTLVAGRIPQVFLDIDLETESNPDVPLLRFIDVSSLGLGEALEITREIVYLDVDDGYKESDDDTKSTLVDHDVATLYTLLWLCKFIGTRPLLRFNSSVDIEADPFVLDSSELDSGDVLRLTSYTELNPPALTTSEQETLLRWQMHTGYYGRNAGSLPAVVEAAKLMLIGTEYVNATYDYSQEPFVVNLQTYWYETFGALGPENIGDSSQLVIEAVEQARPLGTAIRHEMIG